VFKYLPLCLITVFLVTLSLFNLFGPIKKVEASSPALKTSSLCTHHILSTEEELALPSGMLLAISIVEAGVNGKPHPYAVHKRGRSYYAKSPAHAKSLITNKNGSYLRNTSVGCMQLQTTYHHKKFASFDEMISPEANVKYGGNYLKKHFKTYGNWSRAVRRYNGGKARQTRRYLCKVYNVLRQIELNSARLLDHSACGSSKPYVSHAILDAYQSFHS